MSKRKETKFTPSLELLKPSINIIRDNLLIYFVLAVLPSLIFGFQVARVGSNPDFSVVFSGVFFGSIISLLLYPPLTYTYLQTAKNKRVELSDAFRESYKYFWPLIGTALLSGLIIIIGFILFIIPGVIMLRRYLLAPFYVMDRKMGVTEAMETSAKESKEFSSSVYGIIGVNVFFGLIGVIPIIGQIIGAILQILYSVAPALRYFEIKAASKS